MIATATDDIDLSLVLPYSTQKAIALYAVAHNVSLDVAFDKFVTEGMRLLAERKQS